MTENPYWTMDDPQGWTAEELAARQNVVERIGALEERLGALVFRHK